MKVLSNAQTAPSVDGWLSICRECLCLQLQLDPSQRGPESHLQTVGWMFPEYLKLTGSLHCGCSCCFFVCDSGAGADMGLQNNCVYSWAWGGWGGGRSSSLATDPSPDDVSLHVLILNLLGASALFKHWFWMNVLSLEVNMKLKWKQTAKSLFIVCLISWWWWFFVLYAQHKK